MSITEIFKMVKVKNHYVVQSCLVLSFVVVTTWVTISIFKKKKNRKQQNYDDKIILTPLIVITGCDTGLGYSIVMRYLNDDHCNENKNYCQVYNHLSKFYFKKLTVPNKIAIVAFCLNPNSPGAKCLLQLSLKSNKIQLFVRKLDLTDSESIMNGVAFVKNLLEYDGIENKMPNKYSKSANKCIEFNCYMYFGIVLLVEFFILLNVNKFLFFRITCID